MSDFRPELGHSPLQEAPYRCMIDSAIGVSQLVSEGNDRAGIGDVGAQLRLVLQGNAQRLTHYLELTLDGRAQQGITGVIGERFAPGELDEQVAGNHDVREPGPRVTRHRRALAIPQFPDADTDYVL